MSKEKQPSDVVFVRLKDRSSIVHDVDSGVTVTGTTIVKTRKQGKIAEAIKHGALDVVTEADYNAQQSKDNKEAKADPVKEKKAAELAEAKETAAKLKEKADEAIASAEKEPKDKNLAAAADKAAKAYDDAAAKVVELEKALG